MDKSDQLCDAKAWKRIGMDGLSWAPYGVFPGVPRERKVRGSGLDSPRVEAQSSRKKVKSTMVSTTRVGELVSDGL